MDNRIRAIAITGPAFVESRGFDALTVKAAMRSSFHVPKISSLYYGFESSPTLTGRPLAQSFSASSRAESWAHMT
jgi:hypothetical protein